MKRGTAAKVILGKDTLMDVPAGIVHGTDVILGGKAGLLNDFGGLVLSNNLMIGKKVSRGTITTVTVRGQSPLVLPDAISGSLQAVKAFGGTEQRNLPDNYIERQFIYMMDGSYIKVEDLPISAGYKVEFDFQTLTLSSPLRNYIGGRATGVSAGGGFRLSKLASGGTTLDRIVLYGFESGTEYYAPEQFQPNTRYKYTYDNGVCTLESGGSVVSTQTFTVTDTTSTNWGINSYANGTSFTTDAVGIYVYSLKVWNDQGELVMNLVPAIQKGTVPVVGFYDTVSKTFKTATAGTFAAGGEAVPTPDTPFDIVSNNGKLVFRDTELPVGYKRLKDIIFDGEVYYVTDTYLTGADTTTFTINATEGNRNVLGCYTGSSVGNNLSFYLSTGNAGNYVRYKDGLYRPVLASNKLNTDLTLSIGPTGTTGFDTDATWTELEFVSPALFYIGWLTNATSSKFKGSFKGNITVSNRATLIPCERTSDGAIGYYNINDNVFFENQGTGTPTTSGYDYSHCVIMTDGTVETINMHGKNLWNGGDITTERIVSGVWERYGVQNNVGNGTWSCQHCTNIPAGTWTISFVGNVSRVVTYDGTSTVVYTITAGARKRATVTLPTDGEIWLFCANASAAAAIADVMVELGSTATEYEPYFDGGTATAEMLLKVGNYQDEQEILSGAITRKVGVKVLDGTETFTVSSSGAMITQIPDVAIGATNNPINTHFALETSSTSVAVGTQRFGASAGKIYSINYYMKPLTTMTVSNFQQWLADQHNAGTPVIIIYPLATPTTETVTGQALQVTSGDNVLEITQASLDNLELEATYKSLVQLTIQEVEDANLNNNVEVTIS